jgi:hypothetical protein
MSARRLILPAVLLLAACSEATAPPKPTSLALVGSPPASATVGSAVTGLAVTVKDEKGNAMSGQPLSISVSGGSLAGAPTQTIGGGATSIGTWTLASRTGANSVTISSGALAPIVIAVQGAAGPPAKVTATTAPPAVSVVGRTLPVPLLVADSFDNPVAGAPVQFTITGGGSFFASTTTTDAAGVVASPAWTLGTTRGTNGLLVNAGTATLSISVVAQADVPATAQVSAGAGQTAPGGTALAQAPRVTVTDRFGNAVASQAVTFSIASGGGTLTGGTTASSDTNGVATAPSWVLGKRNIPQQLAATAGNARTSIAAAVRTSMSIVLRFFGTGMTDDQKAVFTGAAQRLSAMITAGVGPVNAVNFDVAVACGLTGVAPLNETIQGIVIYASISAIDGSGKILAQAGPCAFRDTSGLFQPAIAIMQFDVADLATLAAGGSLEDVATHEMMHTLGYGTIWPSFGYRLGAQTADPRYTGAGGIAGCRTIGGIVTCANTVPLENVGGTGTFASHWRETVFSNELMTGYLNTGANPMSLMSIAAMADLGYTVNTAATDAYSLSAALRAPGPLSYMLGDWERVFEVPAPELLEPTASGLWMIRRTP